MPSPYMCKDRILSQRGDCYKSNNDDVDFLLGLRPTCMFGLGGLLHCSGSPPASPTFYNLAIIQAKGLVYIQTRRSFTP